MKRIRIERLALAIAASLVVLAAASASRNVGQTLVYEVTTVTKMTSGPPASLPAYARAQYEATQAAAAKGTTSTFTFVVDRVDGDGSAHLQASISGPQFPAAAIAIVPYLNTFQATLGADGSIVSTYDPNMAPATTRDNKYHEMEPTKESAQNTNSRQFRGEEFNRFATGCAKRTAYKPGDVWRLAVTSSTTGLSLTYDFSVIRIETVGGGEMPLVSMKTDSEGANGSQKIDASGHYDPHARLVTDFHENADFVSNYPGGQSSGSSTTDFRLRP